MIEPQRCWISEPEGYLFMVSMMGAGTGTPTRLNTRNNYTISRTGVGAITITFQDDPGPTLIGNSGFCFGDPTQANIAGWTMQHGAYTARSGNTAATYTFKIANSSFAAADLPSTSSLTFQLCFKQAAAVE